MKADLLQVRVSKDFKNKLKMAAEARGISMGSYVRDRLIDDIKADLTDWREGLKQEDDESVALA